jgi:hypothetical protein
MTDGAGNAPIRPHRTYGQWYEMDRSRLGEECGLLTEASVKFECLRMPDARLSFICHIGKYPVAIICPHNYPLAPPEAIHVGESAPSGVSDKDGKINLFADRDFTWSADRFVLDVVRKVESVLLVEQGLPDEGDDEPSAASRVEVVSVRESNGEVPL